MQSTSAGMGRESEKSHQNSTKALKILVKVPSLQWFNSALFRPMQRISRAISPLLNISSRLDHRSQETGSVRIDKLDRQAIIAYQQLRNEENYFCGGSSDGGRFQHNQSPSGLRYGESLIDLFCICGFEKTLSAVQLVDLGDPARFGDGFHWETIHRATRSTAECCLSSFKKSWRQYSVARMFQLRLSTMAAW